MVDQPAVLACMPTDRKWQGAVECLLRRQLDAAEPGSRQCGLALRLAASAAAAPGKHCAEPQELQGGSPERM